MQNIALACRWCAEPNTPVAAASVNRTHHTVSPQGLPNVADTSCPDAASAGTATVAVAAAVVVREGNAAAGEADLQI